MSSCSDRWSRPGGPTPQSRGNSVWLCRALNCRHRHEWRPHTLCSVPLQAALGRAERLDRTLCLLRMSYNAAMDKPRPRLPVEVVERIIDAAALLPTCDADLTPKQVRSRYKTLRSCALLCTQLHPRSRLHLFHAIILTPTDGVRIVRLLSVLTTNPHLAPLVKTAIFTAKAAKYGSGYGKPLFMRLDEARSLVHTRWPGLEVVQPPRGSHVGPGPPSALLDAFFKQVVPCLPALRTLRTHVVPASFDPNTPRVIRWRRTLDSLPAHTIVDLELASVIFHRSRDFLAMIKALLSLRVLKCTQVAWGNHEWPPGWPVSRPHSLGLVELELRMSDWLLDLVSTRLHTDISCSLYGRHTSQLRSVWPGQAGSSPHYTHRCPRLRSSRSTKAPCSCSVVV